MAKQRKTILPLLCILVGICGCLQVDHKLTLHEDGSGILDFTYGIPIERLAILEAMGGAAGFGSEAAPGNAWLTFNESAIRDSFSRHDPESMLLQDVSISEASGWRSVHMVLAFSSLHALADAQLVDPGQVSLRKIAESRYRYAMRPANASGAPSGLDQMGEGFRLRIELALPGEIVSTNGRQTGARVVAWSFEAPLGEDTLLRLRQEAPEVVFKGDGLELKEFGQDHLRFPAPAS